MRTIAARRRVAGTRGHDKILLKLRSTVLVDDKIIAVKRVIDELA
jgi:hypothetical protein